MIKLRTFLLLLLVTSVVMSAMCATAQETPAPYQDPPPDPILKLTHPIDDKGHSISGNGTSVFTHEEAELKAQVLDSSGHPVAGIAVVFSQVAPREIQLGTYWTDESGIATVTFQASKRNKEHTFVALIKGSTSGQGRLVYHVPVRKSTWVMFMIFGLAGGLGLFLFGMDMMSTSLQRSAGGRMRTILGTLTANRFLGATGVLDRTRRPAKPLRKTARISDSCAR